MTNNPSDAHDASTCATCIERGHYRPRPRMLGVHWTLLEGIAAAVVLIALLATLEWMFRQ